MSASPPRQWLSRAVEDLAVARLALREGHTAHACFLAQQCAEKSLKAFLLARAKHIPRTHKLVDLLEQSLRFEADLSQFRADCLVMDQYYLPTRYPDAVPAGAAGTMPSADEAHDIVSAAERILQSATQKLSV